MSSKEFTELVNFIKQLGNSLEKKIIYQISYLDSNKSKNGYMLGMCDASFWHYAGVTAFVAFYAYSREQLISLLSTLPDPLSPYKIQ